MKYYNSILELIGNTPLVRLNNLTRGMKATVLAKLESHNPGGSVKDRIGLSMIENAEKEGKLKPGGTIIEATSGNTGIGLALVAALKGYKSIFVMTEKASAEKGSYLKALGAEVVIQPMTAKPDEPEHYVNTAKRLAEEIENSYFPYQYENLNNPMAHYNTTGPEIWNDTEGKVTHFVAGLGTGGTISGTSKYLKEKNSNVKVVGADPYGSIFKTFKETGMSPEPIPYLVEGIGQDVIPGNVWLEFVDEIINVTDKDSVEMCKKLSKEEGIFCGGSTGTIAWAALEVAKRLDENGLVVFIVCDTGERYLSKYHSDQWLRDKRLLSPDTATVGQICLTRKAGIPGLVSVDGSAKVFEALELMDEFNLSTMPVIENNECIGSIREASILEKVMNDRTVSGRDVRDVMDEKLQTVDFNDPVKAVMDVFSEDNAVLVEQHGAIKGVLTRYDVLDLA